MKNICIITFFIANCTEQTLVLNQNGTNSKFCQTPLSSNSRKGKHPNCVMIVQIPLLYTYIEGTNINNKSQLESEEEEKGKYNNKHTAPVCICGNSLELTNLYKYKESVPNINGKTKSPLCQLCQHWTFNVLATYHQKGMSNLWWCPPWITESKNLDPQIAQKLKKLHQMGDRYTYTLCQDCGNRQVMYQVCYCLFFHHVYFFFFFSYCFVLFGQFLFILTFENLIQLHIYNEQVSPLLCHLVS